MSDTLSHETKSLWLRTVAALVTREEVSPGVPADAPREPDVSWIQISCSRCWKGFKRPRLARRRGPKIRTAPFEDAGEFAKVDLHRRVRCGFPEVIFGQGKTAEQIERILRVMSGTGRGGW